MERRVSVVGVRACNAGTRARLLLGTLLGLTLIAVLLPAVAPAAECTDTWTGPAEGSWGTASDWSAGHVPAESDVACIPSGKKVTVAGESHAAAVQGAGSLVLGSVLTVSGEAGSSIANLSLSVSGRLIGAGTVSIAEKLTFSEPDSMEGSGRTVILPGAVAVTGPSAVSYSLKGRTLVNEGTMNLTSGNLVLESAATVENHGTIDLANSGVRVKAGTGSGSIKNFGTFERASEVSATAAEVKVPIENYGAVRSPTAPLAFLDGGSSHGASWSAALGGRIEFKGETPYALSGGNVSGPVWVEAPLGSRSVDWSASALHISGGGANLDIEEGSVTVATLEMSVGTISGPGSLEVTETLNLPEPSGMKGTGTTVVGHGATATMSASLALGERTLVNEGTFDLNGGRIEMSGSSAIENDGTFDVGSSIEVPVRGEEPASFTNNGLLERVTSSSTATIAPGFFNFGEINQVSGKFAYTHPHKAAASTGTPDHCHGGDPVDCSTGNFTETQTDFQIGGRGVGLDLTRTYSAQAAAAGTLGIFGYGWTNSFGDHLASEESGARETLTEAFGGTVPFAKSGASWITPSWSQDTLTGSSEAGFTLTLPGDTTERFSGTGRLESATDRDGNATTLTYNGSGKLEKITDPSGRSITLAYNPEGLVERATDPMGHVVKYAYESKQLKSVTLPGESVANWQFGYGTSHRMTSMTDGRGGKTTNEYDGSNRVISQTDPAGRTTTWSYEAFHTTITNKATGAVTSEWFNSNNQPSSVTRGYGTASATTETFTYAAAGLLSGRTDGDGHTTTFGYDVGGDKTSERDPEGDETRWTYNEAHEVTSETTPSGEKTTITRDADGNPETVSRPAPGKETQTVSYAYGPHGEVESMTNPLGATWTYGYDKYGDRTSETDPEGDERAWAFDEDSQVTSTVSPRGNEAGAEPAKFTSSIERDAQGRPIKITDALGGTTKRAYDADGNVESITDPNGRKTKFTYDADNELTNVERPNGDVEETGYDGAGQVTSQIDGNKDKTTYVRNVLEQPVEIIDPLERKTVQTFDAAGNLLTKADPDGRTTTYTYDKANRPREVTYSSEPAQDVSLGYNEDGDLTSMVDATGESTWEYDQLGRLVHSENGNGETAGWEWNLGEEPVGLTYPNGKSISRSYDEDGRLESVTDWLGHTTEFAYNRDSDQTVTTFPAGTGGDTDEYAWDRADRMAGVTMKKGAETLASLAYSRDPAGQLESLISNGLPGAEEESFSYDEDERLTKAGSAEFGYDAANNITKAPGTTNAFDKASEIESATGAAFTFDKEGERTKETPSSGPATTYKYDQAGNLTAVERAAEGEAPAIAESFGYDGLGLLASRTVGLTTSHLVWDLTESPELLLSDGVDSYVYGPGGLAVEEISSGEEPTYLHHDQLGTTRLLTNTSGEATGTFTYGSHGALTGHTGSATTPLGYAGQYTFGQSGLLYLRARDYDPTTGQFLTLDPAVEATREPYGYAGDNPLRFKDPTGLSFVEELEGGGLPCFWCAGEEVVREGLEGAVGDAGWLLTESFGQEKLDEAEGEAAEDVPCGEETRAEIGDRQQQRDKDRELVEKERQSQSTNPSDPFWPPSGSRIAKVIAVIGRFIGQGF